tara:strand:- start:765 stop:1157 length:393 start_codon:yes stop_codon:yes gene_type:complete
MPSTYKRKTNNPKLAWSPERRAAWSKHIREQQAKGVWNKKSKRKVGLAISKGKKAANKKKRLSIARKNGWETRRANGNCDALEINPTEKDLIRMLDLLSAIGFKLTVEEFTEQAVKEKMDRVAMVFNNGI